MSTKPEGPAQEPQYIQRLPDGTSVRCNAQGTPATPAPSQRAGAREWASCTACEGSGVEYDSPGRTHPCSECNGKRSIYAQLEHWRFSKAYVELAQQTAAKDALIRELRDGWNHTDEEYRKLHAEFKDAERLRNARAEAAERERDSLREVVKRALDMKQHGAGNEFWDEWEINAAAALKAGKDGQQ